LIAFHGQTVEATTASGSLRVSGASSVGCALEPQPATSANDPVNQAQREMIEFLIFMEVPFRHKRPFRYVGIRKSNECVRRATPGSHTSTCRAVT
jgi:hypothetical protein